MQGRELRTERAFCEEGTAGEDPKVREWSTSGELNEVQNA